MIRCAVTRPDAVRLRATERRSLAAVLAGHVTVGHQAVDQAHGRRVRQPEDPSQLLDRAPGRELMQGHERGRSLAAATSGCFGRPNDAI